MYQLNQSFPHGFEPNRQDETEARVMLSRAVECVPHSARGLGTSGEPSAHNWVSYKKFIPKKDILGEMFFLKIFLRDSTILQYYMNRCLKSCKFQSEKDYGESHVKSVQAV